MTWVEMGGAWLVIDMLLAEAVASNTRTGPIDPGDDARRYVAVVVLWPLLVGWLTAHVLLTGKLPSR